MYDLSTEVSVASDDEIGMLALSYERMRLSLRAVVSTVLENSKAVSEASSTLGEESKKSIITALEAVLKKCEQAEVRKSAELTMARIRE